MLAAEQMEARRSHLGASEVAAVLGLSSRANAHDVWLEKTGRLEHEQQSSEAAMLGSELEPSLLTIAERELGPLERQAWAQSAEYPVLAATADGIVLATGEGVEIKTSGLTGPIYGDWGPAGTDEVPEYYAVQCQVGMLCHGATRWHLFALLGGLGLRRYTLAADPEMQAAIGRHAVKWWRQHVTGGEPPEGIDPPALEILRRVRRVPQRICCWGDREADWVARLERVSARRKRAEKIEDTLRRSLIAAMQDAEAGELPDGRQVTYLETRRNGYTVQPTTYRTLRLPRTKQ